MRTSSSKYTSKKHKTPSWILHSKEEKKDRFDIGLVTKKDEKKEPKHVWDSGFKWK